MLVDSHCHLDFPDFAADLPYLIQRAAEADVGLVVTICTRVARFAEIAAIAEAHGNVFCSVGTHPEYAAEEPDVAVDEIVRLSAHPKCVAIGEAGLDYFYEGASHETQIAVFRRHCAAARETQLPLSIHSRDADADMAAILEDEMAKGAFPALLHCFSSGRELMERAVALGVYISCSGIITFKRSDELRAIVADVPEDRLLVETDAPYLAPVPFRGKTNEPSYVARTAGVLADVRGRSGAEIAAITTANFRRLFTKVPAEAFGL